MITVLFFAAARVAAGRESMEVTPEAAATPDELWVTLIREFPALALVRPAARLARNEDYIDADARFADGDVVAIIPPVSGG